MDGHTDGWTDGHTDGRTDELSYRDARTHLKNGEGDEEEKEEEETITAGVHKVRLLHRHSLYHSYL